MPEKGLLFTYLLTYGGSVLALFNPFHGLLIYVCFAIVKPDKMWFWAVPEGNYSRIVGVALLLGWLLHGCGRWQFGRGRLVVFGLVGFWSWSILSAFQAADTKAAWEYVEAIAKIVLPFLVGITTIDSLKKLKQLAWVILLSQGYVAYELNHFYVSGYNRVFFEGFADLDNNSVSIGMVTCVGLAAFMALAAEGWWTRAIALGAALAMTHAVLISFSRGGMLALTVTGVVAFCLIRKQPKHYLGVLFLVLAGVYLAGPEVRERFMTVFVDAEQRDASAQSRLDLWRDCLDAMFRFPILGVGPDNWKVISHEYGWPPGKLAHSLWLQIGAELGLVGLSLLVIFYFGCMLKLWRVRRMAGLDPWFGHAACMVIAALAGFAVSAQFVSLDRLEVPYYIALLGAGVLKVISVPQTAAAGLEEESAFPASDYRAKTAVA